MRIALVLDHFDPGRGGLEAWADQWTRWLVLRGYDVHVTAFDVVPGAAGQGVTAHILPRVSGRWAKAAEAEKFLRRLNPGLIHDLGVGWHYDILQPQSGSRLANAEQDILSRRRPARFKKRLSPLTWRRMREWRALERRQYGPGRGLVVAVSRLVQSKLQRRYGLDPGRTRLIYNGINLKRLTGLDGQRCRDDIRKKMGLDDQVLFLFAGHNFRLKGLGPGLEALSLLKKTGQDCRLAVIGRGPQEEYLALARKLNVSDRVSFCGYIEDDRPYFLASDALLHPTFYDACSLAVEEAWAFGLPVITTRFNGAAELMTSGVHGWVLNDPRNVRELARLMESLLDFRLRHKMSGEARALGARQSQEDNFTRIENIFKEARCPSE